MAFGIKIVLKALKESPQFYLAMMEQSDVLGNGEKEERLYFAREATNLNGSNIEYQKKLAFMYIDVNKFEESLVYLDKNSTYGTRKVL